MKSLVLLTNSILAVAILSSCSQTSTKSSSSPATDDFNLQCSDSSGHCLKAISNSTGMKFLTNRTYHPFLSTRNALYITAKNTLYSVSSPDGALTEFATYTHGTGDPDAYFFNPFLLGHYIVMSALVDKIRQFAYVDLNSNDKKIILADKAKTKTYTTLLTPVVQGNKAYYPTYKDTTIAIQTIDASNDITFSDTTDQGLPDSELTYGDGKLYFGGIQFNSPLINFCAYDLPDSATYRCVSYDSSPYLILNSAYVDAKTLYYGDGMGRIIRNSTDLKSADRIYSSSCESYGCIITGIGLYNSSLLHLKTLFNKPTDQAPTIKTGSLTAINPTDTTNTLLWSWTPTGADVAADDKNFVSDLVYNGKNLYVAQNTSIYLFDASAKDKGTTPKASLNLTGKIIATPVLSNDKNSLYVVTEGGIFHIINLAKAGLLLPQ